MSKFKYEPVPDDAMQKATQSGGDFDSYLTDLVKFQKVEEGEHTFRILPRTWNAKDYGPQWYVEAWLHREVGPDKSTYVCPMKMKGNPCPICEAISEMDADSEEKAIDKIKARRNYFAYIVDRKNPKEGIKVWRFGVKLRRNLTLRCQDKKTKAWLQISDPDEGYDISFRREGSGLNTEYVGEEVDRDASPLADKPSLQETWMGFVVENPLPDQFIVQDYEYLDKVFRGKRGTKEDRTDDTTSKTTDADEDEAPKQPASRAGGTKKPKQLEPVDSDVLLKMDDEELALLIEEYGLDIDPGDVPTKKLRREVISVLEERGLLADDENDPPKKKPAEKPAGKKDAPKSSKEPEAEDDDDDGEGGVVGKAKKSLERLRPGGRG